jgi:hypothetical protein
MQDVGPTPPPVMYWSKAPVWGALPTHGFRAHTVTLADNAVWISFGGCDDRGCFKDMLCFNMASIDTTTIHELLYHSLSRQTMQWHHPKMQGDLPPPCRAH